MDKRTVRLLAAAILLVAALLVRLDHLDWGLPAVEEEALPTKVALQMWGFDDGTPDFDPKTAGWPALSFYVQRAAQQLHYLAGRATGSFDAPMDYYVAWLMDPTTVILIARVTSVLCSLVVCLVALVVGFRFDGVRGGAVAGALCAFSPLLVRHAQYVEPDALVGCFSALALLWCLRILDRGRVRDYALAGLWIGLGTASKYTPVLMAATVLAVHLERRRAEGASNRWLGLDDRRIGWAALVAVLAFCVTSPYTLADLGVLRRDFAYQALHMRSGHFGHEQQGLGYWHYLTSVLPQALGWPALLASLTGLVLAARSGAAARAVLWTFLPFFLVLGSLSTHFDRYMLPLVLPLALAGALLVGATARRWPRHGAAVSVGLAFLLLAMPVRGTLRHHQVQSAGSTQEKAGAWVLQHMDVDREVLATEQYGPSVPLDHRDEIRRDPAFARMTEDQQTRLLERPFVRTLVIPMYSVRTDLAGYYYDLRHYLTYDWLALSRSVRNRYEAAPERFPRQAEFYRLVDELLEAEVVFTPGGRLRGPGIAIYRLDDAVREQIRERLGELDVEDFVPFATRLHAPHFLAFAEGIATHAEFRERWEQAALWWQILGRTTPEPELRARSLERAGLALMRLQDPSGARTLFEQLQSFAGREVVAWANLGLIAESAGDFAAARAYYEQILASQPDARAEEWARRRLAGLDAGN